MTTDWAALSDQRLWSRAPARQDGEAFGQLFVRHGDAVYAHCFRRAGIWSVAEDLTSVVFLEAWRRRRACDRATFRQIAASHARVFPPRRS